MAFNVGPLDGSAGNNEDLDPGQVVEAVVVADDADYVPGQQKLVGKGLKPVDEQQVSGEASRVVREIMTTDVHTPAFRQSVNVVTGASQDAMLKMGEGPSRLLDRSMKDMSAQKNSPQEAVANTLLGLQSEIEEITGGPKGGLVKAFGWVPGVKSVDKMMKRYESAQGTLNNITESLMSGKNQLMEDNASLEEEKTKLRDSAYELFQYMQFTDDVKSELEAEIQKLRATGRAEDTERADIYESQLMFPIQQQRQDLRTQIAVAVQAFETMDLIQKNNEQLAKGVDRARATTLVALRTAVMVSQAQQAQQMVSQSLKATTDMTNGLLVKNAKDLQKNTMDIHQQAVNTTVDPKAIEESLRAVEQTAASLRDFHKKANVVIEQSVQNLDRSVARASQGIKGVEGNVAQQYSIEK